MDEYDEKFRSVYEELDDIIDQHDSTAGARAGPDTVQTNDEDKEDDGGISSGDEEDPDEGGERNAEQQREDEEDEKEDVESGLGSEIGTTRSNGRPRKRNCESLYLRNSSSSSELRIDYVLAYVRLPGKSRRKNRRTFEQNLEQAGLQLAKDTPKRSADGKTGFVKLHAPWEVLARGAELLNMQKRIKMSKNIAEKVSAGDGAGCLGFCPDDAVGQSGDYFTSEFTAQNLEMFDMSAGRENFFTCSERSLIVRELLERTSFAGRPEASGAHVGIQRLLQQRAYQAAFPLHDSRYQTRKNRKWPKADVDRQRLFQVWARLGCWYKRQPLDLIRNYFGERIGIYFVWLGFYTQMLILPAVVGVVCFAYGLLLLLSGDDAVARFICGSNLDMCPRCINICPFWKLREGCTIAKVTILFDNAATIFFAGFMAVWATLFLELWERKESEVGYDWDVDHLEYEERLRPEYELSVKTTELNPITMEEEPVLSEGSVFSRKCLSAISVLFFILVAVAAIGSIIIYRFVTAFFFYKKSTLMSSVSASVLNLIIIFILNKIYAVAAQKLTEFEMPRTESAYNDSLSIKLFTFQFVNFYGSLFYVAFLKGRFGANPGSQKWGIMDTTVDKCDPAGCITDLFIQLSIIMVGKQIVNTLIERYLPKIQFWWRNRKKRKLLRSQEARRMRWEQDYALPPQPKIGLLGEYLEMVIQFGFVTLFVAAFPLGPLFALINNAIEIRVDAHKFVCDWRRGPAVKAKNIGSWFTVLRGLTYIAVVTNGAIISLTSEFVPKVWYVFSRDKQGTVDFEGYVNTTLSLFLVSDFQHGTLPTNYDASVKQCYFSGHFVKNNEKYEPSPTYWKIVAARMAFFICFEHVVFFLIILISLCFPNVSGRVQRLQLYEMSLVRRIRFDAKFGKNQ